MWFTSADIDPVKGAGTIQKACENCNNETEHVLVSQPYGVAFGIPFVKKAQVFSHRAYFLACPTCGFLGDRISKDEAKALIRRGRP